MYDRRLIKYYMRRYQVTMLEIERYRHIKKGALVAQAVAQRNGLDVQHVYNIQYVVDACRAEARSIGFRVGIRAWESGVVPVFGRGMAQAAQLYNYRRLADGKRRSIFR